MEKDRSLIIRADAGTQIGAGHIMRCLALGQAWQDRGGKVIFACADIPSALASRLEEENMEVVLLEAGAGSREDAIETADLASHKKANWVVVDGYVFNAEYQKVLKEHDLRVLFIDDYGQTDYYWADLVLNQNIYADEKPYVNRAAYTKLLLGSRYALVRREFLKWKEWQREIPKTANNILVTLGGSDPENVTLRIIEAITSLKVQGIKVKVVVGPSNKNREAVQRAISEAMGSSQNGLHISLVTAPKDVSELMAWADIAVSAAGSTCWELAFMGLPAVLIILAENQCKVAEYAESYGSVVNAGKPEHFTNGELIDRLEKLSAADKGSRMSEAGRSLIDGLGSARILEQINNADNQA